MQAEASSPGNRVPSEQAPGLDERRRAVRSAWIILAVLICTALSLTASAFYSGRTTAKLDEAATSIATDAAPAIEHLTAIRVKTTRSASRPSSPRSAPCSSANPSDHRQVVE